MEAGPNVLGLKPCPGRRQTPVGLDRPSAPLRRRRLRHGCGSSRTFSNTTSNAAARTSSLDGAFADSSVRVDHHSSEDGSFTRPAGYNRAASRSTTRPSSSVRARVRHRQPQVLKRQALRRESSSQRFQVPPQDSQRRSRSRRGAATAGLCVHLFARRRRRANDTPRRPWPPHPKEAPLTTARARPTPWSSNSATIVRSIQHGY